MQFYTILASAEATSAEATGTNNDLFSALGIDWRLLIIQIVAFLLLVWLLGKFVYPWLMKSVDQRQADAEAAANAATRAQEKASDAQAETARLLAEARREAAVIVSTAKSEATELATASEARAKKLAEHITVEARAQLQKDIAVAKRELHNETLELVARTTQKVVAATHTQKADEALIAQLLKDDA